MNIERTKLFYNKASDFKLTEMVTEANTLLPEAFSIFKSELVKREMHKELLDLEQITQSKLDYSMLTFNQLQTIVSERLETGESLESIKSDLSDSGINVFELFNEYGDKRESAYDVLTSHENTDAVKKLKNDFNYNEEEIEELKNEMHGRSNTLTVIGIVILLFGLVGFFIGKYRISLVFGVSGIGLIVKGMKVNKK